MSRKIFSLILTTLLLFPAFRQESVAQTWDKDIRTLRNNIDPGFHQSYDNYLQYSPAALMLGLKACGYQGSDTWGRMLVTDGFSILTMAAAVNAVKYSLGRERPDGSAHNSFPSGHTATSFMCATMLHHEYAGRSPWISLAGYTAATVTSATRIMNNRHWMTDTFAGAVIGVGSVEVGDLLAGLIFKDRGLHPQYSLPDFGYSDVCGQFSVQVGYDRRFIIGSGRAKKASELPYRGSGANLSVEIPVHEDCPGICVEGAAGSLLFKDESSTNVYSGRLGLCWGRSICRFVEFELRTLAGYAGNHDGGGLDFCSGASLNLITSSSFKLKADALWESFACKSFPASKVNSVVLGYSAAFYW